VEEDTRAFNVVMEALKMPKDTEEQKASRQKKMEEGSKAANVVPLAVLEGAPELLRLSTIAAEKGNTNATSDAATASSLALAAAEGAYFNVLINLKGISDKSCVAESHRKALGLLEEAKKGKERQNRIVEKLLSLDN
jgi:glutamate formiminotransferase/formiminotetrahydrofolate cyclodeaminase